MMNVFYAECASLLVPVFIEMPACVGSCINGPCIREHRSNRVLGAVKISDYAGKGDYGIYDSSDIDKQFGYVGLHNIMPGLL
jgi:iron only hydrogenase large subunit-like protein